MGFDSLFAGLLAGWIVEKHDQNKKQKEFLRQQPSYTYGTGSTPERLFVNSRNKQLTESYKKVSLDFFEDSESNFGIIGLMDSHQQTLRYYYSRLEVNPSSFDCRTELIHFIFKIWRDEENEDMIDLLQNELIYMIDYMSARSQEERMYQHLAMFLSAECHFFKGEFAKALKRLYQALDWQEIYNNVDDKDGMDFNGLYYFHEAIVSNIINLYALAGLPENAQAIRTACRSLVNETQNSYHSLMAANSNDPTMRKFLQGKYNSMMATNQFEGYYIVSDTMYSNNLFKESVASVIAGQAIYSIETLSFDKNSFTVIQEQGFVDDKPVSYNSLKMDGYGTISNYEAALDRDREEMRII